MTNEIMIRCDNPEKNKINVKKYIRRKIYGKESMPYIKYNNHKYFVRWYGYDNKGNDVWELWQIKTL